LYTYAFWQLLFQVLLAAVNTGGFHCSFSASIWCLPLIFSFSFCRSLCLRMASHVVGCHGSLRSNILDTQFTFALDQELNDDLLPERTIAQKSKITERPLSSAVNLKEADHVVAVDFVARRMQESTLASVSLKLPLVAEIEKTHLAYVDQLAVGELDRVRREIPSFSISSSREYRCSGIAFAAAAAFCTSIRSTKATCDLHLPMTVDECLPSMIVMLRSIRSAATHSDHVVSVVHGDDL
ncbi:hypothetical protein KCU93_g148, partial [Aureobasidium melanogenum]